MKTSKLAPPKKLAISIGAILTLGVLLSAPFYFSYVEVKAISDKCYDNSGLPKIEKSGLKIDYFACSTN
ncbi:hypothetical protein GCM10008967_35790 [Bacillus carboniphilus]|uniref:Uncharacterized protein n=1 Tax=Bacillus carboniphilus TaxID=86663 RepID=A0ABN0WMY8_9BACI